MIGLVRGLAARAVIEAGGDRGAIFCPDTDSLHPAKRVFAEANRYFVPTSFRLYQLLDACQLRMTPET